MSLTTPLNNTVTWSTSARATLLSGVITVSSNSKVYINGTAALRPTKYGVRLALLVDGNAANDTQYTAVSASADYLTLVNQLVVTLSPGTHSITLEIRPDGFSDSAGSARNYSLLAFEV